MARHLKRSNLKAQAEAVSVQVLVDRVESGLIRVPSFQRGLRWEGNDVVALFDSIYRGYPVGSLLLSRGKAEAQRIDVGLLSINAPETESAQWVVDGQQRITALAATLLRAVPIPTTPIDPWVVYFDAKDRVFQNPPRDGSINAAWVPAVQLLDASTLSEWVHNWTYASDASLRSAVFEAGARIRQYEIPLYVIDTNDQQSLRDVFYRINNFGRSMKWPEIHDALFGHKGEQPSTLAELAAELGKVGFGEPEEGQLLSCIIAFKGLDVTRSIVDHYRKDQGVLKNAVNEALPAIRSVLSFLQIQAGIPHIRLLPRSTPLPVLTRFFATYPAPNKRTLTLLTRWTWRTLLGKALYDERTFLRRGVSLIVGDDEEDSTQRLLALLPPTTQSEFAFPERFDARAADSRIALIALASLKPLDIHDESPVDVAALIDTKDVRAFRKITSGEEKLSRSPANRILLPGTGIARKEVVYRAMKAGGDSLILRSHAISRSAAAALVDGQSDLFLKMRREEIEAAVNAFGNRFAEWSRSDRPSVDYLLNQIEGET